ncbi:hypothetical protein C0995_005652 [Termitomyces sp. Mi166|nr:hypothetical protein C0995_005652 [Termitomyces sp. Mi166\
MKELVPGWDDDDVDEILVMCPKTERQLTTIEEESSRAQEYYSRETVKEIVSSEGALKPERARFFACEILQALTALHAAGIIHRDIRPENIVIDNAGHIIVTGFESSEILPYSSKSRDPTFCTTPTGTVSMFCAPELLLGWSHDYLVDTWGFGMLLMFMITGRCILGDSETSPVSWKKMIVHSPIVLPLLLETSAHDLISRCLERNPMARPSLLLIKKHNYFSSVDWKKVAAKRIRVPCPLHVTADENRSQFRSRLDRVVSSLPRTRSRRFKPRSHVGSSEHGMKIPENLSTLPVSTEDLQALPSITCVSLFDDLRDTPEPATLQLDPPAYGALTLNDASSNPLKLNITSRDHLTSFWESLDSEQAPALSETSNTPDLVHRPRKLRKTRSSIYPGHRVSALSTLSLQNLTKLRKFGRSTSALPRPSPILDLPEGIKQIGGGIGFKYNVPAAARSRVSICTNTPQTCHGIFKGRLHGLGIGLLRLPATKAKAKTRCALESLVISTRQDDPQVFPTEFRGSNWSFVMPTSRGSRMESGGTELESAVNSPVSEPAPLTPTTLGCANADVASAEGENFEENAEHKTRPSDDALMTLRLVVSSGAKETRKEVH